MSSTEKFDYPEASFPCLQLDEVVACSSQLARASAFYPVEILQGELGGTAIVPRMEGKLRQFRLRVASWYAEEVL